LVSDIEGGTYTKGAERIFGSKRDELTGGWRKLYNEELHNFHPSPSIIRMMKSRRIWTRHVVQMGAKKNAYRILMGKPLGRPRYRCVDTIKNGLCGME
jgi:hypothetical protein